MQVSPLAKDGGEVTGRGLAMNGQSTHKDNKHGATN